MSDLIYLSEIEFDLTKEKYKYSLHYYSHTSKDQGLYSRVDSYIYCRKKQMLIGLIDFFQKYRGDFLQRLDKEDAERVSLNSRAYLRYFSSERKVITGQFDNTKASQINGYWFNDNPGSKGFRDFLRCVCKAGGIKCKGII